MITRLPICEIFRNAGYDKFKLNTVLYQFYFTLEKSKLSTSIKHRYSLFTADDLRNHFHQSTTVQLAHLNIQILLRVEVVKDLLVIIELGVPFFSPVIPEVIPKLHKQNICAVQLSLLPVLIEKHLCSADKGKTYITLQHKSLEKPNNLFQAHTQ